MDEKQMTKGREAYRMMDEACNQLVQSGNWQRVGSSDIKLFLDMYVQALLLKMAQTTGEISGDMLTYIARVPARDILKIGQAAPQQALNIGFKNRSFAEGTPLLLRCCVAMDDKDGTATAQQFVDGVSRLLYAAADVDGDMSGNELNFITAYAGGLRTFLMTRAAGRHYDGAQEAVRRVDIPGGKPSGGAAKAAEESGQPEKKMAPLPDLPLIHGSSQACSAIRATRKAAPTPQAPTAVVRSTPHRRGQALHPLTAVPYRDRLFCTGLPRQSPWRQR